MSIEAPHTPVVFDSFEAFYEGTYDMVVGYLLRLGCPPQDVEDLAQQSFLKVFLKWEEKEVISPYYVGLAARNLFFSQLKRKGNTEVFVFGEELDIVGNRSNTLGRPTEKSVIDNEALDLIDKAINALPFDRKMVLESRLLEDTAYEDLALQLGKDPSTLRTWVYRSLKEVREALKEEAA